MTSNVQTLGVQPEVYIEKTLVLFLVTEKK